jgi:hypothetical protein
VVARADGGGGLWWSKPMMEVLCIHVWAPRRAVVQMAVLRHQIQRVEFLYFKKTIIVIGLADITILVAIVG